MPRAESEYTGTKYVRLTIKGIGKKDDTIWALPISKGKKFSSYWKVDREGERKDIQYLVQNTAIVKELPARQTKKYGTLEVVKKFKT